MVIWFDMDGTIADFYGVENWLDMLNASDPTPYKEAKPLIRFNSFAKILNNLQKKGYQIGIISWLSKTGTDEYNEIVTITKKEWLTKHLPSVKWDTINIVKYGTPKQNFCSSTSDILFDDEINNRNNWTGIAYDVNNILAILKTL